MRYRLVAIRGKVGPVALRGGRMTVGRAPDSGIPLPDEKASRQHCVLEPDPAGGGWLVRDLQSRNGTKVNGQRVGVHPLAPGDVLAIGDHEFLVEVDGGPFGSTSTNVPHAVAPTAPKPTPTATTPPAPTPARPAPTGGSILTLDTADPSAESLGYVYELGEIIQAMPPKGPGEAVFLIDAGGKPSDVFSMGSDGSTALMLLLQLASKARGTDIHLEPKSDGFHVRLRVDGDMAAVVVLPRRVGEGVYGVVKAACHMQVAGRDALQDGHFSAVFPDRRVEYRVSFSPSVHGQKLVLRVLDQRGVPASLHELGLLTYMEDRVRQVCEQDHGLLLTCGPTGSGKTTTLYSAIRQIDRETRNVVTIEDPVEYQIDNVTQIPIDEAKGNTFGLLLRGVLRQDPDVILVGEIRDEETARTAMQAAMTGHLVFTSVHAKESITAVFRLLDLRVEPYLVANSLNLVLAQRLVRVLCDHCKRPIPVAPGTATRLGRHLQGKSVTYAATGCVRCLKTGYRGRRALFELLDVNDELRDVILRSPSIQAMKKIIEQGLFTTLSQFGWRLVAEGVTSLDEVDRVAGV